MQPLRGFKYLKMMQKWKYFDNLYKVEKDRVAGFYNEIKLGLCLTNAIFAMIMSSTVMMNYFQDKMNNCCELNLKKNLNIIYDDPLARNEMKKRRYDLHLPSFLAHGLMDTCRGHMYNTSHGFAGDYLLINNYAECYRDKSYGSPYDHYFIRENIQGERKCKFVIGLSKSKTPHDFDPWVDILKVLFGESNQFLYNDYFTYYTKDDVQLLHVMMEYENEDEIPKYEPFHFKNFTDIKGLGSVRGFGNHLKLIPFTPKVIIVNFKKLDRIKISPSSTVRIFDRLITCTREGRMDLTNIQFYINIFGMTLPELASENPTVYFPISEGRNKLYNIKSFSLRIEDEVIINTNLLKLDWPERTEPRFSVCADRLYDDLMEYPKVLKIPINDTFILNRDPDNKRLLMDYLLAMCVAINKDKVLQSYRNAPLKVHQVALIHRDNRWLLMNDDKSVVIHDIVQFSKHLIGDNIYTVVLEEGEQDKITTTTITTTTTTTIKNDPSGDATTTNNNGLVKDLEKLQLS